MEQTKKSPALFWLLFLASVVLFFVVYKFGGGYCSLTLPLITTFLAKALNLV